MMWMWLSEAVLMGIALAMDALAVSVALAAAGQRDFNWRKMALTALFFGGFQFMMPLIGWMACWRLGSIVQCAGSYVAGGLLAVVAIKMWMDGSDGKVPAFSLKQLSILAFATSIDALLVGASYACIQRYGVWKDALIIGLVTGLIVIGGCIAGRLSGHLLGKHCAAAGGIILLVIALKIVIMG